MSFAVNLAGQSAAASVDVSCGDKFDSANVLEPALSVATVGKVGLGESVSQVYSCSGSFQCISQWLLCYCFKGIVVGSYGY